jgi:nucleoside-diphosphate-sugar epimerase
MRVAITGANGYVGSNVVSRLERDGDTVIRLVRKAGGDPGAVRYSLGETLPASSLRDVEALVHCAYDFMQPTPEASVAINVEGTRNLFRSARDAGVRRIVYISSMSAFATCRSAYGRTKLAIEEVAAEFCAAIVRPGLVYGNNSGHIVGKLEALMHKTPVLPIIGGNRPVYFCHVEDVATGVAGLCRGPAPNGVVTLACPVPVTFKAFLRGIAKKDRMFFIPVPYQPVLWGLRIAESLHLPLKFRSDSLIGLMNTDPSPDFSALHACGYQPRAFL